MIISMLMLASGLSATLPIDEVDAFSVTGIVPAKQSNVYNMYCVGGTTDIAGNSIGWQTNYFDVTSDNIDAFQARVYAIVRQAALEQENLSISPYGGNCVKNQTSPQDFNETRYNWEARMREQGARIESFFVLDIVDPG
jgi:hypothetical protein